MPEYVVVVLGDIGRSPRMMNHAVCLSKLPNSRVHLVGYNESPLFEELQKSNNVVIHKIRPFISLPRSLFFVYAPMKIFWLFLQLFFLIFTLPKFEMVIAQNPPSIPTIPFCWLLRLIKGKRFVIDWHNLGWSILQCNKTSSIIVKFSRWLEYLTGRHSDRNITVTKTLKEHLKTQQIESFVVYDRPSALFKPSREARTRFSKELKIDEKSYWIMSSTSWTPDEEVSMILDAADILDKELAEKGVFITFIITGKGPGRRAFESEVEGRNYSNIDFKFAFLSYEDYALLLGSCDAGVSLHVSSSGYDLPMKGLDMIGAGLPLLSVDYNCISELVQDGVNGLLFANGSEFAERLRQIFVTRDIDIDNLRKGSVESGEMKWEQIWDEQAKPVLIL